MKSLGDFYRDKRVLLTGHTGFKGSWLALWLHEIGANITGFALAPETTPSHWELLKLPIKGYRLDIRNLRDVRRVIYESQPEVIFHLAAQPLVRRSYRNPLESWSTNVMGTANILDICREQTSVRAIVVITTDKCYENREWLWGYRENDPLGGYDPYSASKAASELVAASYRSSFFASNNAPLLATARAGNVVGGGDWSQDRLIPDLIRALESEQSLEVRSPNSTRPWLHVLDSLRGYLMLGQRLLSGDRRFAEAWNFGPEPEANRTVSEILDSLGRYWNQLHWHITQQPQPNESTLLYLDSTKARCKLNWQPVWNIDTTLKQTVDWYRAWMEKRAVISRRQLMEYIAKADEKGKQTAL